MSSILGNYLSYGDLIVVHLCGQVKTLNLQKSQEFLGLTITDNANGRAFIKRVKSDDDQIEANIKPGDHIAAINSESMVGLRHYEVAKAIRLLPQNCNFTMLLIEPKYSEKYVDLIAIERNNSSAVSETTISSTNWLHPNKQATNNADTLRRHELSGAVSLNSTCDDLINSSLPIDKLLSKSSSNHQGDENKQAPGVDDGGYKQTIERINSILDSFLGINDNLLAIRIYRLARENEHSYDQFLGAFKDSELSVFNFDEEMKNYLWNCSRNNIAVK